MLKKLCMFMVLVMIQGCSHPTSNEPPPNASVEINNDLFDTTLGSYCWANTCADAVSSSELLEGKEPIKVKTEETVSLNIAYNTKPNDFTLYQNMNEDQIEVQLQDHSFTSPEKPGLYYYTYAAWWLDDQEENVSNGSANYVFALEVY